MESQNYIIIKGGFEIGKTYIGYDCDIEVKNSDPELALTLWKEYLEKVNEELLRKKKAMENG